MALHPSMTTLHLELLGTSQLALDGERLAFPTAKARALLIYLALEGERVHTRESLMTLLWDQSDDTAARNSLRQALAVVRDVLGDASRETPFLLVTRDSVQCNPAAAVELDVHAFRRHILQASRPTRRPADRVPAVAAARERALALYRGEFLAGALPADSPRFAEWATIWRERLHQQALEAAIGLARHRELAGDAAGALRMWRRALAIEPWQEDIHEAVMRLLAARGDRAAALAQYGVAEKVLAEELAVAPGRGLRELRAAIAREDVQAWSSAAPTAVRAPATGAALIGREVELGQLADWLADPAHRVITVHGPGGVGKTSLALVAARHNAVLFPQGAVFVALAATHDPGLVPDAVLRALEIEPAADKDLATQLITALGPQTVLLVLDNVEHLLPAVAEQMSAWLSAAPGLTLLVTSRTRLGLKSEWVLPLDGLAYAAHGPSRPGDAAAELFVSHVRRHRPEYTLEADAEALGRLCRAVEGLPMALELAAALTTTRSVDEIATALDAQHLVLAADWPDAPERHRSIAALFEYSWRALDAQLQSALACCGVFHGGFAPVALAAASDQPEAGVHDRLQALVDRALVRPAGEDRYDLHELVRAFVWHKLDQVGGLHEAQQRHVRHFLTLGQAAERAEPDVRADLQLRLRPDLDNFRAALAFALTQPDPVPAAELATSFSNAFSRMGAMVEVQSWLTRAIAVLERVPDSPERNQVLAQALNEIGANASFQFHLNEAEHFLERALGYARQGDDPVFLARVLAHLARNYADKSESERAEALMLEALAAYQAGGSELGVARSYGTLAEILHLRPDLDAALGYYREAIQRMRALQSLPDLPVLLANLGMLLGDMGQWAEGQQLLEESIAVATRIGQDYVIAAVQAPLAGMLVKLARATAEAGEQTHYLARARELTRTGIRDLHAQGIDLFRASAILQMAEIEFAAGDAGLSAQLLGAAEMARALCDAEWEAGHKTLVDALTADLGAALGPRPFNDAFARGRSLSLPEVLTLVRA